MSEIIAVLDTNVLVQGIVARKEPDLTIINLVKAEYILLCANKAVMDEYRNIFNNQTLNRNDSRSQVLTVTNAHITTLDETLRFNTKHVTDRTMTGNLTSITWPSDTRDLKFLHAADQAVGSTLSQCFLVSRDKHILELESMLEPFGIFVVNPHTFLNQLTHAIAP